MSTIVGNLDWLLNAPDCPDLKAIRLMAGQASEAQPRFEHPPMVAFGTEKVIQYEIEDKAQLTPKSIFENMTVTRRQDLVLTSWAPADTGVVEQWIVDAMAQSIINARQRKVGLDKLFLARQLSVPISQVEAALSYIIKSPTSLDSSWVVTNFKGDRSRLQEDFVYLQKNNTMPDTNSPANVVTIFAHDTYDFLKELRTNCLDILTNANLIKHWDTTQMLPGMNKQKVITQKIDEADIIIWLISPSYFEKDSEWQAMHLSTLNTDKCIVPIIAKKGFYKHIPELKAANIVLPTKNAIIKELDNWPNRNDAWEQITDVLDKILSEGD